MIVKLFAAIGVADVAVLPRPNCVVIFALGSDSNPFWFRSRIFEEIEEALSF